MVKKLRWKHFMVIANNIQLIDSFGKAAQREDICVTDNILVNTNRYVMLLDNMIVYRYYTLYIYLSVMKKI